METTVQTVFETLFISLTFSFVFLVEKKRQE